MIRGGELRQAVLIDLFQERRLKRPVQHLHLSEFRRGVLRFCVEERVDLEPVALTLSELMPNLPWDCEFHPLRLERDPAADGDSWMSGTVGRTGGGPFLTPGPAGSGRTRPGGSGSVLVRAGRVVDNASTDGTH